jgi:hypothetical protein
MNVLQQARQDKITAGIGSHRVTTTQHERPVRALALIIEIVEQVLREGAGLGTLVAYVQGLCAWATARLGEVFVSPSGRMPPKKHV